MTASASSRIEPSVTRNGITVRPTVQIVDGVVRGTLRATSKTSQPLKYEFLRSSHHGKLSFGTVPTLYIPVDPQSFTILPYANWLDGSAKGVETFQVLVSEVADPSKSVEATISVDVAALAPGDTPIAFTYKVESFNGVKISTNFFPALGLASGEQAPTILYAPGVARAGDTNVYSQVGQASYLPGIDTWRDNSYNVVTWDARGTFDSRGMIHINSPFYEGRDVSSLISWISEYTPAVLDGSGDPKVGMAGGSFGGSIQLVAAGTDPRIDGIAPADTWNSLMNVLNPLGTLRWGVVSDLINSVDAVGASLNGIIRQSLTQALLSGRLSAGGQALLAGVGPTILLHQLQAPVLLIQDAGNTTMSLTESANNAMMIMDNPFGTPVNLEWIDSRLSDDQSASMYQKVIDDTVAWMDYYVSGIPNYVNFLPQLQWWDQNGDAYSSSLYPFDIGFNSTPLTATKARGSLQIATGYKVPVTQVNIDLPCAAGFSVVAEPTIAFTYRGSGDARAVFARVIDKDSGEMIGSGDSPIPVRLDGQSHTVSVALPYMMYRCSAAGDTVLQVQIRSAGVTFARRASGSVNLSSIQVQIPIVD